MSHVVYEHPLLNTCNLSFLGVCCGALKSEIGLVSLNISLSSKKSCKEHPLYSDKPEIVSFSFFHSKRSCLPESR